MLVWERTPIVIARRSPAGRRLHLRTCESRPKRAGSNGLRREEEI